MLRTTNEEYETALQNAVGKAVIDVGRQFSPDENNAIVLLSAEAVTVFLTSIAFVASTSLACSTPQKTREFSEWCAKRLRKMIPVSIEEIKKPGMPFTVINDENRH